MFFASKKLSQNLREKIKLTNSSTFRAIIIVGKIFSSVEKAIKRTKGQIISTNENLGFISAYLTTSSVIKLS